MSKEKKKKPVRNDQEMQAAVISTPIELWHTSFVPLNGKFFAIRETPEDLKLKSGLIINANVKTKHKYYLVAQADDCTSKKLGLEKGDEIIPFMPEGVELDFQSLEEIIDGNLVRFYVMWESEMAGFKKHTRKIIWKNSDDQKD